MKYNNYLDRIRLLSLESLEIPRLEFDLMLVFKILNNILDVNNKNLLQLSNQYTPYDDILCIVKHNRLIREKFVLFEFQI